MTRPTPTDDEKAIRAALVRANGNNIQFVKRNEEDRPDFLFRLNGRLIACEAIQIPPAEIIQYNYKKGLIEAERTKSVGVQVVWATEPHLWVASAIRKKRSKIVEYKRRTGAADVWLIVHTKVGLKDKYVYANHSWQVQLMKYGASSLGHNFRFVYFWDETTGFLEIFRKGRSYRRPVIDFTNGYPSSAFTLVSGGEIKTTEVGEPPMEYDFGEIEFSRIIVPPFDPEFRKHPPNIPRPKKQGFRAIAFDTSIEMTIYDLN